LKTSTGPSSSPLGDLSHPFHDGHVNVVSGVGAVITLIFFALLLATAYVTYMVYFRGVTHFEDLPNVIMENSAAVVEKEEEMSVKDNEDIENQTKEPTKKRRRKIVEREVEEDEDIDQDSSTTPVKGAYEAEKTAADNKLSKQIANGIKKRIKSPAKSPGKRGPVGHDEIEFEILDPQPTEDDIRHTTSMNGCKQPS